MIFLLIYLIGFIISFIYFTYQKLNLEAVVSFSLAWVLILPIELFMSAAHFCYLKLNNFFRKE